MATIQSKDTDVLATELLQRVQQDKRDHAAAIEVLKKKLKDRDETVQGLVKQLRAAEEKQSQLPPEPDSVHVSREIDALDETVTRKLNQISTKRTTGHWSVQKFLPDKFMGGQLQALLFLNHALDVMNHGAPMHRQPPEYSRRNGGCTLAKNVLLKTTFYDPLKQAPFPEATAFVKEFPCAEGNCAGFDRKFNRIGISATHHVIGVDDLSLFASASYRCSKCNKEIDSAGSLVQDFVQSNDKLNSWRNSMPVFVRNSVCFDLTLVDLISRSMTSSATMSQVRELVCDTIRTKYRRKELLAMAELKTVADQSRSIMGQHIKHISANLDEHIPQFFEKQKHALRILDAALPDVAAFRDVATQFVIAREKFYIEIAEGVTIGPSQYLSGDHTFKFAQSLREGDVRPYPAIFTIVNEYNEVVAQVFVRDGSGATIQPALRALQQRLIGLHGESICNLPIYFYIDNCCTYGNKIKEGLNKLNIVIKLDLYHWMARWDRALKLHSFPEGVVLRRQIVGALFDSDRQIRQLPELEENFGEIWLSEQAGEVAKRYPAGFAKTWRNQMVHLACLSDPVLPSGRKAVRGTREHIHGLFNRCARVYGCGNVDTVLTQLAVFNFSLSRKAKIKRGDAKDLGVHDPSLLSELASVYNGLFNMFYQSRSVTLASVFSDEKHSTRDYTLSGGAVSAMPRAARAKDLRQFFNILSDDLSTSAVVELPPELRERLAFQFCLNDCSVTPDSDDTPSVIATRCLNFQPDWDYPGTPYMTAITNSLGISRVPIFPPKSQGRFREWANTLVLEDPFNDPFGDKIASICMGGHSGDYRQSGAEPVPMDFFLAYGSVNWAVAKRGIEGDKLNGVEASERFKELQQSIDGPTHLNPQRWAIALTALLRCIAECQRALVILLLPAQPCRGSEPTAVAFVPLSCDVLSVMTLALTKGFEVSTVRVGEAVANFLMERTPLSPEQRAQIPQPSRARAPASTAKRNALPPPTSEAADDDADADASAAASRHGDKVGGKFALQHNRSMALFFHCIYCVFHDNAEGVAASLVTAKWNTYVTGPRRAGSAIGCDAERLSPELLEIGVKEATLDDIRTAFHNQSKKAVIKPVAVPDDPQHPALARYHAQVDEAEQAQIGSGEDVERPSVHFGAALVRAQAGTYSRVCLFKAAQEGAPMEEFKWLQTLLTISGKYNNPTFLRGGATVPKPRSVSTPTLTPGPRVPKRTKPLTIGALVLEEEARRRAQPPATARAPAPGPLAFKTPQRPPMTRVFPSAASQQPEPAAAASDAPPAAAADAPPAAAASDAPPAALPHADGGD